MFLHVATMNNRKRVNVFKQNLQNYRNNCCQFVLRSVRSLSSVIFGMNTFFILNIGLFWLIIIILVNKSPKFLQSDDFNNGGSYVNNGI